jgi:hypothetical protein
MALAQMQKKVILFGGIISTRGMIDTGNGTTSAIYTVSRVHDGEPDLVFLGEKNSNRPGGMPRLSNTYTCIGEVKAQVPLEGLTDGDTKEQGEFIERLSHNGQNHKLVFKNFLPTCRWFVIRVEILICRTLLSHGIIFSSI